MKILHIHASLQQGGIEAMITALANEMSSQGEDVSVCSIFKPTSHAIFWNKLAPNIHKFDLGKSNPGFSLKEIFKIYNFIRKNNFDVVNIHGFFYYYALTVLFRHSKTKFFYTIHSDAEKENSNWDSKILKFKQFCFKKRWMRPVTISPKSQEAFLKLYHCCSYMVPNGVKRPVLCENNDGIKEYKITEKTKVFVHPGRISTPKNQLVLVKVFDSLIKDGYDVVLLIAGSNDDNTIYHKIEPYFSDRIKYIGIRSDVPQLLSYADGLCLPSIWEGLPVTLLEALSVGCIPICSPVGGIVNVIRSGENGLLSESSSETDYYKTMRSYLSMPSDQIVQMKVACLDSFSDYDIKNTAKRYLKVYNDGN